MIFIIIILLTVLNLSILFANIKIINDFKITQILFINQQNRNTIAISDIKSRLLEINH